MIILYNIYFFSYITYCSIKISGNADFAADQSGGRVLLFDCILLMHFKHLNGERSDVAIFHILKGRKSIQTVQDIHIFKLEKFYGISSFLNKKQFDEKIEKLKRDGKITIAVNSHYVITKKGLDWLGKNNSDLSINCLNGYKYERIAADFYERLI